MISKKQQRCHVQHARHKRASVRAIGKGSSEEGVHQVWVPHLGGPHRALMEHVTDRAMDRAMG